jgi:hypothetical protein
MPEGGGGVVELVTVRLNEVTLVSPPPTPETVMGYVPVGVEVPVEIVNVVEQFGLQELGE